MGEGRIQKITRDTSAMRVPQQLVHRQLKALQLMGVPALQA